VHQDGEWYEAKVLKVGADADGGKVYDVE